MKSTFSLLALAFATAVVAVPMPGIPADPSTLNLDNTNVPGSSDVVHGVDESIDKRGMMFGPHRMMLGINGVKRSAEDNDVAIHSAHDEGIEKRGMMFGPIKMMLGLNGVKRDTDEADIEEAEDVEKRGMMFGPHRMMLGLNGP